MADQIFMGLVTELERRGDLRLRALARSPREATVRGLLLRFRTEVAQLWARVSEHNAQAKQGAERYHVSFYLGQHLG